MCKISSTFVAKNKLIILPFGRVRNGFPFPELVRVAVARRFWNSLNYDTV